MRREDEYRYLADSARRRGGEEKSALLRAQWEILAATYVQLARSIEEDRCHWHVLRSDPAGSWAELSKKRNLVCHSRNKSACRVRRQRCAVGSL